MSGSIFKVTGILLAAGESRRFGRELPKQLAHFRGETLVRRMIRQALQSGLSEVIAVTGHQAERVESDLLDLDIRLVRNPDYLGGQSTSVRAGLAAVSPDCGAALFLPVDQPLLSAEVIDRILKVYREQGAPIVVPVFKGRRGAPVLFGRRFFSLLEGLEGDEGGRRLLRRLPEEVVTVELEDGSPLEDIDTYEDLRRLEMGVANREAPEGND